MIKLKLGMNIRSLIIVAALLGMTAFLVYGLHLLTIQKNEAYEAAVSKTSEVTTYQSGVRGTITDRNGVVLAYDETTYNVIFYRDPNNRSAADSSRYTEALIKAIDVIEEGGGEIIDTFYINMLSDGTYEYDFGVTSSVTISARKKRFVEACNFTNPDIDAESAYLILRESWRIPDDMPYKEARKVMSIRQEAVLNSYRAFEGVTIAYDVSLSVVAEIDMMADELVGITTEKSSVRVYPEGDLLCHVIGYLGKQVTTDMSEAGYSYDDYAQFLGDKETLNMLELGYSYSDYVGVAGVEKTMEAYLTPNIWSRLGSTLIEKSNNGAIVDVLSVTAPSDGLNVALTIDIELQKVVEQALIDNIDATKDKQEKRIQNRLSYYLSKRKSVDDIATAETGAIVVMEVDTGNVLAMASYPNYDLNLFSSGLSTDEYELLFGADSNQPTLNRAIASRNAPGSVFKMATGFAGLMEGKITTTETISDHSPYYYFVEDPTTKVEQNAPSCWVSNTSRHANLTLSRAITVSCNYYFFTVADRVGIERLNYWAGRLGLKDTTGVQLPGELSVLVGGQSARYNYTLPLSEQQSSMPRLIYNSIYAHLKEILTQAGMEADAKQLESCAIKLLQLQTGEQRELGAEIRQVLQEELNIPSGISLLHTNWVVPISTWLEELRWKPTYTIQTGIGQGVVLLTPISLARYICTLANRGYVYQANIIDSVSFSDGTIYKEYEPVLEDRIEAPDEYWQAILEGMQGVVSPEDGGTASSVFSAEFTEKYLDLLIGKTGTAQTSAAGESIDIENNSWFVIAAPREDPKIVVAVYIPNGYSGSSGHVAIEAIMTYWIENCMGN